MTQPMPGGAPGAQGADRTYRSLCSLPVFRPVALKLLKMLVLEDVEVREVTRLLASDPGLAAEVMTLANSALFGCAQEVATLARAISVLGLERMKSLALTVTMQAFTRSVADTPEGRDAWRHSLACAFAAEELATRFGQGGESAYMQGLMHDVGRFGLLAAYPCVSVRLFASVHAGTAEALEEERRLFGMDHCEAGACLAQVWGLPEPFRAAAARHHCDAREENAAVRLTAAACLAADALGFEAVHKARAPSLEEVARSLPGSGCSLDSRADGLRAKVTERFGSLDSSLRP